ncbi:MAG TPA: hypothetical protein VEJ36_03345 [Nitrososphaerales archaeon]|nr:hypothetical protein [Nitrososphaerales archaeon]
MDSYPVRYRFSQSFDVPAEAAYRWCIDYRPDDWGRMGKKGTRRIRRINEDTIILTDTVESESGPVTKRRLVRLHPERLAWTNTHLGGPNRHSQFWYQIVSLGRGRSKLEFTGLQVNYGRRPSPSEIAAIARELRKDDSNMWVLLAKEMSKDKHGASR